MNSPRHGFSLLEVLVAIAVLAIIAGVLSGVYSAIARAHDKGRALDRSRLAVSRIANRSWAGYSPDDAAAGCPSNWPVEYVPVMEGGATNPLALDKWTFVPSNHPALRTELYLRRTGE